MNDVIISTAGSLRGFKVAQTITSIITMLIGFFAGCMFFAFKEIIGDDEGGLYLLLVAAIAVFAIGFSSLLITTVRARTYVKIYMDHIEGVGMQGTSVASFNVVYSQVNSISAEKDFIHIYTNVGTYKILTKRELANQVVDYYNRNMRNR